jgi:hypothetical protein
LRRREDGEERGDGAEPERGDRDPIAKRHPPACTGRGRGGALTACARENERAERARVDETKIDRPDESSSRWLMTSELPPIQ